MDIQFGRHEPHPHDATQLGVRQPPDAPAPTDADETRLGSRRPDSTDADGRTRLGHRQEGTQPVDHGPSSSSPIDQEIRFGPGLTADPTWRPTRPPSVPVRRRRAGGRTAPVLSTLAVIAVLAYVFLGRAEPLAVVGADVAPTVAPGTACDVTVDLVGTIYTNGRAGAVQYRWLRSDGETTPPFTHTVSQDATSVQVHLLWTLAGEGTYPASATLQILQPQQLESVGHFTYSCRR